FAAHPSAPEIAYIIKDYLYNALVSKAPRSSARPTDTITPASFFRASGPARLTYGNTGYDAIRPRSSTTAKESRNQTANTSVTHEPQICCISSQALLPSGSKTRPITWPTSMPHFEPQNTQIRSPCGDQAVARYRIRFTTKAGGANLP